ncbi:MAG: DsrE/DsrF/DrsH-like family protein [Candidatus Margulisiibacteriota bacterium]
MDKKEKLSLIVFSGDFDKAIAAFTLATGAAATNREVNMFFTFWGLNIIRKNKGRAFTGSGVLARTFNFLMGGVKKLPLSRFNFLGISPKLMTYMMKKKNVATLDELIEAAKALKINFIACEMAMQILEIKKEDLIDEVKAVVGVPTFLDLAKDGMTLFI